MKLTAESTVINDAKLDADIGEVVDGHEFDATSYATILSEI